MISLRMLGAVALTEGIEASAERIAAQSKPFALLAFLAASRPFGFHRRDALIGLLWPELDQEHARAALRKSIHRLRATLGADVLLANGDESIGVADGAMWCDVRAFDAALREDRTADAIALYAGDLLPGFFVSDAPEFERWLDGERQDLRARAVGVLLRAADEAERSGDAMRGAILAQRAVHMRPDDEQGVRRLIQLLDRAGERAGSIRAYEALKTHLAAELQIAPSPATTMLIESVRSQMGEAPLAGREVSRRDTVVPRATASDPQRDSNGVAGPTSGVTRVRRPSRRTVLATLTVVSAVVALAAAMVARRPAPSLDPRRVGVLAFRNETGRPELDFIGLAAQDWITRGLQLTGLGRAVPALDGAAASPGSGRAGVERGDARQWASQVGLGTLVGGRYYLRGDSIQLQAWVVAVSSGEALATLDPVSGSSLDPNPAIDVLRQRTIAVMATHLDPAFAQWASAASRPPSYEAFKEVRAGLEARNRDDYRAAVDHYDRAASLDSTFIYPTLLAADLRMSVLGERAVAESSLRVVRGRGGALAPFDDALAGMLESRLAGDIERLLEESQRLRRYVTPGSDWELDAAAAAVALNRPREAMEAVNAVDLHRPPALDHWDVFVPIANAYHLASKDAALLALLRREAGRWAEEPLVIVAEMEALAALGRPTEARQLWRTLLRKRDAESVALAMWAAMEGTRELRAHGSGEAARALAIEALDSIRVLPPTSNSGDPARWRMQVLREAGRDGEALVIARTIVAAHPLEAGLAATRSAIEARLGDSASARSDAQRLANRPPGPEHSRIELARARLSATLGDRAGAVALLHTACDHGCMFFEDLHGVLEFAGMSDYAPFRDLLRPTR